MSKITYFIACITICFIVCPELGPTETIYNPVKKTVLFDLYGVLLDADHIWWTWEIGPLDFIGYFILDHGSKPILKQKMATILEHASGKQTGAPHTLVCGEHGQPESQAIRDLYTGTCKPEAIARTVCASIEALAEKNFFISDREKRILSKILSMRLHPEHCMRNFRCIKKTLAIVRKIHAHGHTIMMLSNIGSGYLPELQKTKTGKKLLQYIKAENWIASADTGYAKPDPHIFSHVIRTRNLTAQDCIFVDDQPENTLSAQACGIAAFHLTPHNHHELYKFLTQQNIFA